jgi:inner membrane protein YidH
MSPAEVPEPPHPEPKLGGRNVDDLSFLLSSRRTRLSFHRTRLSTDRTLMSIVRTAISLIGFGFTIFQFFQKIRTEEDTAGLLRPHAPRNFGIALVALGVLLLTLGIAGHIRFMTEFRKEHDTLVEQRLVPHDTLPYSMTLAVALLLWCVGLVAIVSMVSRAGPFG